MLEEPSKREILKGQIVFQLLLKRIWVFGLAYSFVCYIMFTPFYLNMPYRFQKTQTSFRAIPDYLSGRIRVEQRTSRNTIKDI